MEDDIPKGLMRDAIINNKPKVYRWVNGLKFYAQKGDAGIVPNIYFKLFDFEDSK